MTGTALLLQLLTRTVFEMVSRPLSMGPGNGAATTERAAWVVATQGGSPITNVCAQAPPGVDAYTDLVIGWVKYGSLALIVGAAFISIGAMIVGKIGGMSRAAQGGSTGLVWSIIGAIAYVTIYGILTTIVGKGC